MIYSNTICNETFFMYIQSDKLLPNNHIPCFRYWCTHIAHNHVAFDIKKVEN